MCYMNVINNNNNNNNNDHEGVPSRLVYKQQRRELVVCILLVLSKIQLATVIALSRGGHDGIIFWTFDPFAIRLSLGLI